MCRDQTGRHLPKLPGRVGSSASTPGRSAAQASSIYRQNTQAGWLRRWGLTPRSSGAPTARRPGREALAQAIMRLAARAPCRRRPLSSNVRPRIHACIALARLPSCPHLATKRTSRHNRAAKPHCTNLQGLERCRHLMTARNAISRK
jgi:hypothetical protein